MSIMNTAGAITVTIVPSTPAELIVPFQLGPGGVLATTNDPVQQALNHILAVAFTLPTERVMNPNIGVGVQAMLFSNSPLAVFQEVASQMQTLYQSLESASFVTDVSVTQNPTNSTEYVFTVTFALDQDTAVHTAVFNYAGQLVATT